MRVGHSLFGDRLLLQQSEKTRIPLSSVSVRATVAQIRALADNLRRAADAFEDGQITMTRFASPTSHLQQEAPPEIVVHFNRETD